MFELLFSLAKIFKTSDEKNTKMNEVDGSRASWVFYLIGLFDAHGDLINAGTMYKGSTDNLQRRLRQHCGIVAGGARRTSRNRNSTGNASQVVQVVYKPICIVSGFTLEKHVRQFEAATKQKPNMVRARKRRVPNEVWSKIGAFNIGSQIKHVLQTLCCQEKWVSSGPDVRRLALTVEVWKEQLLPPLTELQALLPAYLTVRSVPQAEQQTRLSLPANTRCRPWLIVPW
jgi:predicted GIY-YIG superfamily endonuclease